MTKKEQYSLKFIKIKDSTFSDTYLCQGDILELLTLLGQDSYTL